MTTEKATPLVEQFIRLTKEGKIVWEATDPQSITERLPGYPIQGLVFRTVLDAGAAVLYRYLGRWYRDEDEYFMLPYERLELRTKTDQVADSIDSVPVPELIELYNAVTASSRDVNQLYDQWMQIR
jgi:hypothetical protein